MATINLYINTANNSLVVGQTSQSQVLASSLALFCPDTPTFNIYLLSPVPGSNQNPPFSIIPTTGLQFFFYVDDGTLSGTIYTQQITWVADPSLQFWTATVAFNTAGIIAAIGSSTSGLPCWLKLGYVQGGLQTTVLSQQVTIAVGMPSGAVAPTPAGQTTLTVEVARQTYIPQVPVAGQPIELMSAGGIIIVLQAIDNGDGTARFEASQSS